jgi:ubiquinone/menaquinone biosynthesis C-methylase UbiE
MYKERKKLQKIIDSLLFPVRALFVAEDSYMGLTSLRDERMEVVALETTGHTLDIGCGRNNMFISNYVHSGVGIDVFGYEGVDNIVEDMTKLPFENETFDTVTLIAVGGHIPEEVRVEEFKEIARVLKIGGKIVLTEGEPITQTISHIYREFAYKLIGKVDMDSERGMEHDEQYCMPYDELMGYLNTSPLQFQSQKKFMWGLNNIYIAEKNKV